MATAAQAGLWSHSIQVYKICSLTPCKTRHTISTFTCSLLSIPNPWWLPTSKSYKCDKGCKRKIPFNIATDSFVSTRAVQRLHLVGIDFSAADGPNRSDHLKGKGLRSLLGGAQRKGTHQVERPSEWCGVHRLMVYVSASISRLKMPQVIIIATISELFICLFDFQRSIPGHWQPRHVDVAYSCLVSLAIVAAGNIFLPINAFHSIQLLCLCDEIGCNRDISCVISSKLLLSMKRPRASCQCSFSSWSNRPSISFIVRYRGTLLMGVLIQLRCNYDTGGTLIAASQFSFRSCCTDT